jgi:glycine/D-amino acid oxidase-like deaminating enzyme
MSADARVFDDNQSVWLVGAPANEPSPPLAQDLTVDVAIIGGGFTGVSTAYHVSRRNPGLGIALLEAKSLGNGASGRSGGMMLTGIQPDPTTESAVREHQLTAKAIDDLVALIKEHDLQVRYRREGSYKISTTAASAEAAHADAEELAKRGLPLKFLRPDQLSEQLRAQHVFGATFDPSEGVLNGVDLIRAMKPLLLKQGVQIFEGTPVTRVRQGETIELSTPGGTVRAKAIVLATNGYTPRLGFFRTGILPVISHVIATKPLSADLRAKSFGNATAFADDLPRLAYSTIDFDGRVVFGGGTNAAYGYQFGNKTGYSASFDDKPTRALRGSLARYFPELANVELEHRWSGPLGVTLARHCGIGVIGSHSNIYYALGYSGHGIVLGNLAGRVIADLYAQNHDPWKDYSFYMYKPGGIPPEPMRWVGYHVFTKLTGKSPFKNIEKK